MELYEICEEFRSLQRLVESGEDSNENAIRDEIDIILMSAKDKAIQVAKYMRNLEVTIAAIDGAIIRMAERKLSIEKKAKHLEDYLIACMSAIGEKKVESPELVVLVMRNPPSVKILDESKIPDKFWVQPPQPPTPAKRVDKKEVLSHLKNTGEIAQGCEIVQTVRLMIK